MKNALTILFILLAMAACWHFTCGSGEGTTTGGGDLTGVTDDDGPTDDDDDTEEPEPCEVTISNVYNCELAFFKDGYEQSFSEALTECLALWEISDAWICRVNCGESITDCNQLFECLTLCPNVEEEDDYGYKG